MDGFRENEQIIVVGATNLFSRIDPALSRPGRFDHIIEVKLPSEQEIHDILNIYLKGKKNTIP
jgi:ATP-dependent 26S proteasome regulatory subunit